MTDDDECPQTANPAHLSGAAAVAGLWDFSFSTEKGVFKISNYPALIYIHTCMIQF